MAPVSVPGCIGARTVLVADDDENFRVALAEALEGEGCEVIAVRNGTAVLAVLDVAARKSARRPDLLVLDLVMPHMSGMEVLQRLRKSPEWRRMPVLVVTGIDDPMLPVRLDVPTAFKTDAQTLLAAVREQLARRRIRVPGRTPTHRS
jgi:CheY-like chemotaxis protein